MQDGQTGGFLSYRRAGLPGTEYYVLLGDPNSPTFTRQLQFKVVWAF